MKNKAILEKLYDKEQKAIIDERFEKMKERLNKDTLDH
jgi:hypothetical protein